jgi:hypothetical protein
VQKPSPLSSTGEGSRKRAGPLTEADVRAVLDEAADPMQLADSSDRPERATRCRPHSLSLAYETEAATGRELVRARPQLCRGGGPISTCDPTEFLLQACLPAGDSFPISSALQNWPIGVSRRPGFASSYGAQNRSVRSRSGT